MRKFSLVELLVVMGILLLLMSLLLPNVGPMMNRAELSKIVSAIVGQLDVGYTKSFDKNQVTRVVIEYDPIGKNLSYADLSLLTGATVESMADEILARQDKNVDLNGDGVPNAFAGRASFFIPFYFTNDPTSDTLANILSVSSNTLEGPFWLRRPIARATDTNGNIKTGKVKMYLAPLDMEGGDRCYFRPVNNIDSYKLGSGGFPESSTHLQPVDLTDNSIVIIDDHGEDLDIHSLDESALKSYTGTLWSTFIDSAALYNLNKARLMFSASQEATNYVATLTAQEQATYPALLTKYFDELNSSMISTASTMYGYDDNENGEIDEGMLVSVELYNQSEFTPKVRLPAGSQPDSIKGYNGYFDKLEDSNIKVSRKFPIGGKHKSGVMLRRVWGTEFGKVGDPVLLWSCDEIIRPGVTITVNSFFHAKVKFSTPYYFYVVFDQKNGSTGMSFGNSFGSVQVEKLFLQISDDDNSVTTMIRYSEGSAVIGTPAEVGFVSDLESVGYYLGVKK